MLKVIKNVRHGGIRRRTIRAHGVKKFRLAELPAVEFQTNYWWPCARVYGAQKEIRLRSYVVTHCASGRSVAREDNRRRAGFGAKHKILTRHLPTVRGLIAFFAAGHTGNPTKRYRWRGAR